MLKTSVIIANNKIRYNYYMVYKCEAGILLKGWEVKNILLGKVQIVKSYVSIINF